MHFHAVTTCVRKKLSAFSTSDIFLQTSIKTQPPKAPFTSIIGEDFADTDGIVNFAMYEEDDLTYDVSCLDNGCFC